MESPLGVTACGMVVGEYLIDKYSQLKNLLFRQNQSKKRFISSHLHRENNILSYHEDAYPYLDVQWFEKISCEKRNASTSLGIEPKTFRLPVECSIISATEVHTTFLTESIYANLATDIS